MLRFRNAAIVLLLAGVVYAILPAERKRRLSGKLREFGRSLAIALVLFWVLIVTRNWIAG